LHSLFCKRIWSILTTGIDRLRFSLLALFRLGGRQNSPMRLRVKRTSRQAMSFKRPFGWNQFHCRQRTLDICFLPLLQCPLTVVWIGTMSSALIVLFLMVRGNDVHRITENGCGRQPKMKKSWWVEFDRKIYQRLG